jgi:hypothetical protein
MEATLSAMRRNPFARCLPAFAAFYAALAAAALAAPKPALVPLNPGDRADYDFVSTTLTPGHEDHEDGTFSLARGAHSTFDIRFLPEGGLNETFRGVLIKDGTIELDVTSDSDQGPFILQRFNQVATLLGGAPAVLKAGDSWRAMVNVPLPRNASVDVPVSVKVVAAGDSDFDLEANGNIKTQLIIPASGSGASGGSSGASGSTSVAPVGGAPGPSTDAGFPITLSLHTAAHFVAGKLDKVDGTIHSEVQARDLIEITSNWSLFVPHASPAPGS